MPNRVLRSELLESESWLSAKDNVDRLAWIACFLTVDALGNMPAGPQRLIRLWRPYGVDSPERVAKILRELSDVDLIRLYQAEDKPYLHIPRFRQNLRFLGHLWPLSPWTENEYKQRLAKKSQVNHQSTPVILRDPPLEVEVEVEVEVDKTNTNSARKGSRLPDGWTPSMELQEWSKRKRPDLNVSEVVEEFRDYWRGVPGSRGRKLDWDATFRNRIRDKRGVTSSSEPWWTTEAATKQKAVELGMTARGGESWNDFRARIRTRLAEAQNAAK